MSLSLARFMMALEFPTGLAEVTATVLSHNSNAMQETPRSGDWWKRDRWIQFTNNLALCTGSSQKSCYWKVTTHSGGPQNSNEENPPKGQPYRRESWAGVLAQQLGGLVALPQDLGLIPSAGLVATVICNWSPKALFWPLWASGCIHSCSQVLFK